MCADPSIEEALEELMLPLTRTPHRSEVPPPLGLPGLSGIEALLRLAAARGASTLYLSSGERPSIRVDGDLQTLEGTAILGPNDVESLLLTLMPERSTEALCSPSPSKWISGIPDVGSIRCMSFRDNRGPGALFRLVPQRAVTTGQLGLSREIQGLADELDGLVIVTGPRLSGKRTLMSAFVDHINRTRRAHIVTVEREINIVHERIGSFVSQREAHGRDAMVSAVRGALREDPDVLMVDDVRATELVDAAIDAAAGGRLVICGFPGRSAAAAIEGIIDLSPAGDRKRVQLLLAQNLRGVVAQVLLKKTGGSRLAARELLLNTPAVAAMLAEGKTSRLPLAIDGGRKHGMVPLNDALGGFVQNGAVDVREAYRCATDRPGLVALLRRQGVDVSTVEQPG
jgi:twitching motility protein PilT